MPTEVSPNEHIMREPGSLQLDPSGEGVAIDETKRLIASNKVEGTPVYNRDGEQLGNVYNFMTAYHSFGGEMEALNTPTIRRLTPSCRHQLSALARLWTHRSPRT